MGIHGTSVGFILKKEINNNIPNSTLEKCFQFWQKECEYRFVQLKENEEELNSFFIDVYGLHNEVSPEVEERRYHQKSRFKA